MLEENSAVAYTEIAVNKNKLLSRSYMVTKINSFKYKMNDTAGVRSRIED